MINDLNDVELSEHIQKIHHTHCFIDKLLADGESKRLFLVLKMMGDSIEAAMDRLNKIETKGTP